MFTMGASITETERRTKKYCFRQHPSGRMKLYEDQKASDVTLLSSNAPLRPTRLIKCQSFKEKLVITVITVNSFYFTAIYLVLKVATLIS